MAMGTFITAAAVLSICNAVLLIPLIGVWVRNYSTFRSTLALGLVIFGVALLVENAVAVYFFFFSMKALYTMHNMVGEVVLLLRGLQFVGVAVLSYVTLR